MVSASLAFTRLVTSSFACVWHSVLSISDFSFAFWSVLYTRRQRTAASSGVRLFGTPAAWLDRAALANAIARDSRRDCAMLTSLAATHRRSSSSGGLADVSDAGARSVIRGQRLARNHGGDARAESVHHGYKSQHLPSWRWHPGVESIARFSGTAVANRLGTGAAATAARRLLAAGNWAEFQDACEISRFPNRSNSDEKRHTNAPAQSGGKGLHSTVEGASLHTLARSKGKCIGWPVVGARLRRTARRRSIGRECLVADISWRREERDASQSLSPTELHLDKEAVSRMDDEGGAPDTSVNPPGAARKARPGS